MTKEQRRADVPTDAPTQAPISNSSQPGPVELLRQAVQEARALARSLEGTAATRVAVRFPGVEIEIERVATSSISATPAAALAAEGAPVVERRANVTGIVPIPAPLVGIFFHARLPGGKPFVEVGQKIERGQQVGIIEAMKLMNDVTSEVIGIVSEILVPNGTAVAYEQPLMLVDVSSETTDASAADGS
jgi:acetyl-CoA carboxylase biotin carboxyl carrier protein